jgi:hypothetical protein
MEGLESLTFGGKDNIIHVLIHRKVFQNNGIICPFIVNFSKE